MLGELDFTVQTESGARYGAAAIGLNGRYGVATNDSSVRLSWPFDRPTLVSVEAAFVVPVECRQFNVRFAAPIGSVELH
jgi:hypothetical protein